MAPQIDSTRLRAGDGTANLVLTVDDLGGVGTYPAGLSGRAREIPEGLRRERTLAYGWTTGQRKSAAPALVTVTSPASLAAKTASSDVSRYGVTPALKVTR
jgi:hypothetical protein